MTTWGKVIGGLCGLMLLGPIGFLIGIFIGHMFDLGLHKHWQILHTQVKQQSQIQQIFFRTTFLVMGYVAKADGRVSEAEIQVARNVMNRMGLNEAMRHQAIEYFTQGKQANFRLEQALADLAQVAHNNKVLLRMFVEIQTQAAMADGSMSSAKQAVLKTISQRLGFAPFDFNVFEDLFRYQHGYQQRSQQQNYQQARRASFPLREAYALLGIPDSASDAEVKRAYRRSMSQNHPDKLVAKGLPEGMIKLATEKTQNIKAAYEAICAARGI